jgi:hypothetical protein
MPPDDTPACVRQRPAAEAEGATGGPADLAPERWKAPPDDVPPTDLGLPRRTRRNGRPVRSDVIGPSLPLAHVNLDYHRGKPAPRARRPWLPEDHSFGLISVVWGLLFCVPYAAGLAALATGLAAALYPPKGRDEDRLLGLLGAALGAANLGYWVWGMRH